MTQLSATKPATHGRQVYDMIQDSMCNGTDYISDSIRPGQGMCMRSFNKCKSDYSRLDFSIDKFSAPLRATYIYLSQNISCKILAGKKRKDFSSLDGTHFFLGGQGVGEGAWPGSRA